MTLGGSEIRGIGLVCGIECMIAATVPTMKGNSTERLKILIFIIGGSLNEVTLQKLLRGEQIAKENNLPSICLVESGGADLTQQFKVFHVGGGHFRELTVMSKKGIFTQ